MSVPTFVWHDYETFGTHPRRDWPAQFAAVRTDAETWTPAYSLSWERGLHHSLWPQNTWTSLKLLYITVLEFIRERVLN